MMPNATDLLAGRPIYLPNAEELGIEAEKASKASRRHGKTSGLARISRMVMSLFA